MFLKESDIKNCKDKLTKKCYFILKQIYGKEYALKCMEDSPYFKETIDNLIKYAK